jgi:hypothetical protein
VATIPLVVSGIIGSGENTFGGWAEGTLKFRVNLLVLGKMGIKMGLEKN